MIRRWSLVLLMAAVLPLSGCFRPASDSEPPVVSQPIDPTAGSDTTLPTIPPLVVGTPTLPPVTIISPATVAATQVFGQPLQTPTPPPVATNPSVVGITEVPATATTGGFITPIVPLGQVTLVLPTSTSAGGASTSTPSGLITPTALVNAGECTYVVQAGDNLFRIATNNNVSLDEMRAANPELVGEAPILQPGQVLLIPGCVPTGGVAATPVPGIAPTTSPGLPTATSASGTSGTTYTVRPGDTLFSISQQFGITSQAIISANNLTNPDRLSVGQQLIIPPAP
jgi:LysM repeat protein